MNLSLCAFSASDSGHGRQELRELSAVSTAAACDFPEANGPRLAAIVRSHWCCESRHWMRDTQWGEDACPLRNPNAACALALIRTGLQTRLVRIGRHPLPQVFEDVSHRPDLGRTWLNQRLFHQ